MNADIERRQLATTERVRWRSVDGMEIEGLVVKPAGFQPGRKYPLVVRPHGGPHGASRFGFNAEYQVYASHGLHFVCPKLQRKQRLRTAVSRRRSRQSRWRRFPRPDDAAWIT